MNLSNHTFIRFSLLTIEEQKTMKTMYLGKQNPIYSAGPTHVNDVGLADHDRDDKGNYRPRYKKPEPEEDSTVLDNPNDVPATGVYDPWSDKYMNNPNGIVGAVRASGAKDERDNGAVIDDDDTDDDDDKPDFSFVGYDDYDDNDVKEWTLNNTQKRVYFNDRLDQAIQSGIINDSTEKDKLLNFIGTLVQAEMKEKPAWFTPEEHNSHIRDEIKTIYDYAVHKIGAMRANSGYIPRY